MDDGAWKVQVGTTERRRKSTLTVWCEPPTTTPWPLSFTVPRARSRIKATTVYTNYTNLLEARIYLESKEYIF
jgi:hypothetical protein